MSSEEDFKAMAIAVHEKYGDAKPWHKLYQYEDLR